MPVFTPATVLLYPLLAVTVLFPGGLPLFGLCYLFLPVTELSRDTEASYSSTFTHFFNVFLGIHPLPVAGGTPTYVQHDVERCFVVTVSNGVSHTCYSKFPDGKRTTPDEPLEAIKEAVPANETVLVHSLQALGLQLAINSIETGGTGGIVTASPNHGEGPLPREIGHWEINSQIHVHDGPHAGTESRGCETEAWCNAVDTHTMERDPHGPPHCVQGLPRVVGCDGDVP